MDAFMFYLLLVTLAFCLGLFAAFLFGPKKPRRGRRPYTWRPDHTDKRDKLYAPPPVVKPNSVDLRSGLPVAFDQGQIGSCTGNAWAAMLYFVHFLLGRDKTLWSRLFIYLCERIIDGTVSRDAGARIRDGAKAIAKYGAPPESLWQYVTSRFKLRPPTPVWTAALSQRITTYMRVPDLDGIITCLAEGFPVVIGFTVFESFESDTVAKTGFMPMPAAGEQNLGGHAVLVVGYDLLARRLLVRNSWGPDWGIGGYFWMPFAYITTPGLADDFWTVRK